MVFDSPAFAPSASWVHVGNSSWVPAFDARWSRRPRPLCCRYANVARAVPTASSLQNDGMKQGSLESGSSVSSGDGAVHASTGDHSVDEVQSAPAGVVANAVSESSSEDCETMNMRGTDEQTTQKVDAPNTSDTSALDPGSDDYEARFANFFLTADDDDDDDEDSDAVDAKSDDSWYSVSAAELEEAARRRISTQGDTNSSSEDDPVLDLDDLDAAGRELVAESGYARVLKLDVNEGGVLDEDDDNNDFYSGVGFDVMLEREEFIETLKTDFGFHTCTHVQLVAMPRIADGENIVMQSYTGTGKTLAFLLPILEGIDEELEAVQAVIVAPTRELAMQIANECTRLCAKTEITSMALIGGANPQRQVDKLRRRAPHVVVGTPGRIAELNQNRVLRLRKVRTVVVDEVDHCLEDVFREHLETVISACSNDRQIVLCSATGDKEIVRLFAQKWMREPALLRVTGEQKMPANITHWSTVVPARLRIDTIRKLMFTNDAPNKAICFVDDPRRVDIVCSHLYDMKVAAGALRGNAHKLERAEVIRLFRKGVINLLVTTEVAARGLDVPDVSHVFNLDLPTDADHYVHRAGRCGRARAPGTVVSIASPETAFVIGRLKKELQAVITPMELRGGEYASPRPRADSTQRRDSKEKNGSVSIRSTRKTGDRTPQYEESRVGNKGPAKRGIEYRKSTAQRGTRGDGRNSEEPKEYSNKSERSPSRAEGVDNHLSSRTGGGVDRNSDERPRASSRRQNTGPDGESSYKSGRGSSTAEYRGNSNGRKGEEGSPRYRPGDERHPRDGSEGRPVRPRKVSLSDRAKKQGWVGNR